MTTFGDRLRLARNALGLTQDELAERMEVTKSAVSAWENGREQPSFDKLPRLRSKLRVSLDELVCAIAPSDKGAEPMLVRVGEAKVRYGGGSESEGLTRDEQRLLRRFRVLNERRKKALITLLGDEQSD